MTRDLHAEVQRVQAEVAADRVARVQPTLTIANLPREAPQCVRHILTALPAKSDHVNFNKLCLNLACYFKARGYTLEGALGIAAGFIDGYDTSDTHDTPAKRKSNFESVWKSIEAGNGQYRFDCSFIKGLHLPGSAFECSRCAVHQAQPPTPELHETDSSPTPAGAPTPVPPTPTTTPPVQKVRFEFIHNIAILTNLRPIEWRIQGTLTKDAFYYDFGESGSYKTFVALDRLVCVAAGLPWHGHASLQGPVFYIAGEGQQGIGRRLLAAHLKHGTDPSKVPLFVAKMPTQLMDPGAVDEVKRAVDAMIRDYGEPAIIHIDTLARNFGEGDESLTKDMNRVIQNLDAHFAGICRGLSHHTGHTNKERARGAYALHAAVDIGFRVGLTASGQVLVECVKMKDAPPTPAMLFDRREVLLEIGDTKDKSYVLELAAEGVDAAAVAKPKVAAELKGNLKKALDILRRLHKRYSRNLAESGRPGATPWVTYVDWRTACLDAKLYSRSDVFGNAVEKLVLQNFVEFDGTRRHVYPVGILEEKHDD